MKKNYYFIIATILILIAALLRLYKMEGFITFLGDQGRDAIIVKRIVTFEHFPAIGAPSSVGQIYLGPFYYYLIAPWLLIFNYNPAGLGYGVAIMSLAGIIASYWLVRKNVNELVAIVFLVFITFSHTLVDLSRFSWNPNLLPIFTFLTVYFFHEWTKRQNILFAILFGSFLALTIQLHYLALIIFLPLLVMYLYHVSKTTEKKKLLIQLVPVIGAFLFFSVPLIIFDLKHEFLNSKSFIRLITEGDVVSNGSYWQRLLATISGSFPYLIQLQISSYAALILFISIIGAFIFVIKKTKSTFLAAHLLIYVLFIFGFALLDSPRHYHYYGPIYSSFYLLAASLILLLPKKIHQYSLATMLAIAFIAVSIPTYSFLYYEPNNQIAHAKKVADSFKPYIKKQPIQIVPIPTTETDGHYRYFLELAGYDVLPNDSSEQAKELYVVCFDKNCKPLDDPQWQIAAFSGKTLASSWQTERAKIYKVIHK
ncbi:hypothetical protein BH09PAT2_BH09PAT2_07400 [soil metagenome]